MNRPVLAACALLACAGMIGEAGAAELTAREAAGRRLYLEGVARRDPQAFIGAESTPVPASAVPCGGCHGEDGRGRPEGGVAPPDITWQELSKPYGHRHAGGRRHPTFDEHSLAAVIRKGIDPAGHRLDSTMPRYAFSREEMEALTAYLKRLASASDPGVDAHVIRIGTLLPLSGPAAAIGLRIKAVLSGYVDAVNARGGIYQRRFELEVADAGSTPRESLDHARRLLAKGNIFAFLSPFTPGAERELADLVEQEKLPVVGPLATVPFDVAETDRQSFYLTSGRQEQLRVLVDYAAQALSVKESAAAVVFPAEPSLQSSLTALNEQSQRNGRAAPFRLGYPFSRFDANAAVAESQSRRIELVYFLGNLEELRELLKTASGAGWQPYFLLPGTDIRSELFDLPAEQAARLLLAVPALPQDQSPGQTATLSTWLGTAGLPPPVSAPEISAYASALLLEEGLRRCGRDLSRAKLLSALESIYGFDTGLMPSLSFGPNRHIGAAGAYVVTIDTMARQLRPASAWQLPRP